MEYLLYRFVLSHHFTRLTPPGISTQFYVKHPQLNYVKVLLTSYMLIRTRKYTLFVFVYGVIREYTHNPGKVTYSLVYGDDMLFTAMAR